MGLGRFEGITGMPCKKSTVLAGNKGSPLIQEIKAVSEAEKDTDSRDGERDVSRKCHGVSGKEYYRRRGEQCWPE